MVVYQWVEWIREYMSRKMERIKGKYSIYLFVGVGEGGHCT